MRGVTREGGREYEGDKTQIARMRKENGGTRAKHGGGEEWQESKTQLREVAREEAENQGLDQGMAEQAEDREIGWRSEVGEAEMKY